MAPESDSIYTRYFMSKAKKELYVKPCLRGYAFEFNNKTYLKGTGRRKKRNF